MSRRQVTADRVDNSNDIIDSRDVIERIEWLESKLDALECPECGGAGVLVDAPTEHIPSHCEKCKGNGTVDCSMFGREDTRADSPAYVSNSDTYEELWTLRAFLEEIEQNSGERASDGAICIRDSHFEDYAQELADDIGAVTHGAEWPNNCIDWAQAARELQYDYSSIDYDGVEYWVRS